MPSIPTLSCLRALLALALVVAPGFAGCLAASPQSDADTVLAVVGGKAITQGDVQRSASDEFEGLEREYAQKRYDLLATHLDRQVELQLIALEAAKRGMSEEDLVAAVSAEPVSDADVDAFFQQNEARMRGTKEQMAPQIREYLEQVNQQRAGQAFVDELRAKHEVDYRLEPLRVEVAATGPARGPADAPVTIVEFADFQCPYCVKILPSIRQVLATYGDKVRFVYRHYPLSIHSDAQLAAEASMCAHEQGKFWEMHDGMFANMRALQPTQLKATAAGLGLDAAEFNACLDSRRFAEVVAADAAAGNAAGVSGTPALFVNGRLLGGAVPLEDITEVVDDELRRRGIQTAKN